MGGTTEISEVLKVYPCGSCHFVQVSISPMRCCKNVFKLSRNFPTVYSMIDEFDKRMKYNYGMHFKTTETLSTFLTLSLQ